MRSKKALHEHRVPRLRDDRVRRRRSRASSPARRPTISSATRCDEVGHEHAVRVVLDRTPVLRRERRPGGRHGRAGRRRLRVRGHRHAEGRRALILHAATCANGVIARGRQVSARRRRRPTRGDPPGPLGHAHPALRPAEAPRRARPAAGLEGRRRLAAVRLHEPQPGERRGAGRHRRGRASRRRRGRGGRAGDILPLAEARKQGR